MEEPTRHTYLFFTPVEKVIFYSLAAVVVLTFCYQVWQRYRVWKNGQPIPWSTKPTWSRLVAIVRDVLFQGRVVQTRWRFATPMHLLLYVGFLILLIGTTLLAVNEWGPIKFHHGTYYLAYELALDVFGAWLFLGLLLALGRRYAKRPSSLGNARSDAWLLGSLLAITVSGFVLEAARFSVVSAFPSEVARYGMREPTWFDWYSPVGKALSLAMPGVSPTLYLVLWWFHGGLVFAFLTTLIYTRFRHTIYSVFSTYLMPTRPLGQLSTISMDEVEKTGKVGAVEPFDYNVYQLASLDACMECGRCTDVCPAKGVGKVLDPERIVQDIRAATGDNRKVAEAVSDQALWDCTTCNACVRICPVNIRHVDLIVDARRALVAEGGFAGTGANMLRQLGSTMSAWGSSGTDREEWMAGLDVPLARDGAEFDVLLWVGCAGAVDKGAQKTNRALVGLLEQAGVKFACLGNEEVCTGDPARRLGEEFLFQAMVEANLATFKTHNVKRIVTACPHCFNTLHNEYPSFGAEFEVVHHTQLLADLVSQGKLKPAKRSDGKVVWHDPCYMARVNQVERAPRVALKAVLGGGLVEPADTGRSTLCCGAGGGRMWMEEPAGQRPGNRRAEQLLATGAKTIAVGCPFCRIMVGDSVAAVGREDVNIVDLAELLAASTPSS